MTRPAPTVTVPVEPTEAMRPIPDRVVTEALYWMARAYERVHSMPRVSDTELANKIEAAKADLGRARDASPILSAPAAPQAAGVGELVGQIDALLAIPDENLSTRVPHLARELLERAASHLRAPSREPEGGAVILKGVGKIDGDGWKDTTRQGEVVFVWNTEKPSPYAPGQYPRIGNEGWSASTSQYDFTPATAQEVRDLFAALATREDAPEEDGARRKLIGLIEQWDGESEYDAEDVAALADDILHAFNGPPVVSEEAPAEAGEIDDEDLAGIKDAFQGESVVNKNLALRRAYDLLRAQPQAREDAQPVEVEDEPWPDSPVANAIHALFQQDFCLDNEEASTATGDVLKIIEKFTHPAPDALRADVDRLTAAFDGAVSLSWRRLSLARDLGSALTWALAEIDGETKYEDDGQRENCRDKADQALAAREEAPAGEAMDVGFEAWLNERNLLPHGAWDWPSIVAMLNHHEDALRARSSAPEALGNLLAVIHGDGGHRALEVGTKQAALEAEKIVAGLLAAPSADKLRGLVGASEDILSALSALSVAGKPIASLDTKLRDAINTLVPALAALQQEPK